MKTKPRKPRAPRARTTLPAMSREEAAAFIATHGLNGGSATPNRYARLAQDILHDPDACADAYKRAARRLHPDAGGSHDQFVKLQQAKEALAR